MLTGKFNLHFNHYWIEGNCKAFLSTEINPFFLSVLLPMPVHRAYDATIYKKCFETEETSPKRNTKILSSLNDCYVIQFDVCFRKSLVIEHHCNGVNLTTL